MLALEDPPLSNLTEVPALEHATGQAHAVFRWGGRRFALEIGGVQEVVVSLELTPLPRAGHGWLGVANLRGEILPAVSPGAWFAGTDPATPVFLILRTPLGKFALAADSFDQVATVPSGALAAAPEDAPVFATGCWMQHPQAEPVLCVDLEALARNLHEQIATTFSSYTAP